MLMDRFMNAGRVYDGLRHTNMHGQCAAWQRKVLSPVDGSGPSEHLDVTKFLCEVQHYI